MDPFSPPYKTGFVGTVEVPKKKGDGVVEYAFEWHDGNPDDEDRSGYGVSVLDGKIVIGGYPIIWHIMKLYSFYGLNDFIICCGYKGYLIKDSRNFNGDL